MTNNNLGKNPLVESCQKIEINQLIREARKELDKSILDGSVEISGVKVGIKISLTGNGGKRCWFCCPVCHTRCGVIYQHPYLNKVGCRKCLNLIYKSQAKKGMVENGRYLLENVGKKGNI